MGAPRGCRREGLRSGWILWGIGSERALREQWVFKGGTCLKKCYLETYRLSEDLDFTVLEAGPIAPDDVLPALRAVLDRVYDASGIDLAVEAPKLRLRPWAGPLGAVRTAMISTFEPFFTAILAALVLGQALTLRTFAGGSLVVVAVVLINLGRERANDLAL